MPPHPANPPTKRPLVALMKQARAFGLGVLVATQNPMDLDYRALSNAGVWCVGRLQTDADRERVVEAISGGQGSELDPESLANVLKLLAPRWFVLRNVHQEPPLVLLQSRTTLC
jgi:DNA helicase HerA-like ATPase